MAQALCTTHPCLRHYLSYSILRRDADGRERCAHRAAGLCLHSRRRQRTAAGLGSYIHWPAAGGGDIHWPGTPDKDLLMRLLTGYAV
jgi:hypothetical protein